MRYINVKQAAEQWGVTPRRVQELCKQGKIPGAQLWERTWMLPEDTVYPNAKTGSINMPLPRKSPFLTMTDLYHTPGMADRAAEALIGEEARALFQAEIAYSRGDIDAVYEKAQYFLSKHSEPFAIIATGMLLGNCAMWKGDMELFRNAKMHICEIPVKSEIDRSIVELSLAAVDLTIRDMRDFPDWFKRGRYSRLPADAHPAAKVYYVKCMIIYAQDLAMDKYSRVGMNGLSLMKVLPNTIEPMITQAVVDKTVLVELHLRLLCAICCQNGGDNDRAVYHIDKAVALALPDRLLGPLAEYRRQLGHLLDDRLALVNPEALKQLKTLHKQLNTGWTKLHNAVLEKNVSVTLSAREREVARLAAFGLSDSEIAEQLNLSKSTVKSLISMAKNKTGSIKRAELVEYI
jgi:LuxR family maltose regulon positive regulatory protein